MNVLNVSVTKTRLANQLTTFIDYTLLISEEEVKPLLYKSSMCISSVKTQTKYESTPG